MVDINDNNVMFSLMETTFLRGPALVYFMDEVMFEAKNPDEAIHLLEKHYLDDRDKMINDDVWMKLTFENIKLSRASRNLEVTHEKVLNDLTTQISELAGIRTGSGHSADVMAKTIAAVRGVDAFTFVFQNPPRQLHALNSALRSYALEADRAFLKLSQDASSYVTSKINQNTFSNTAREVFAAFLVDRHLNRREEKKSSRSPFKTYGDSSTRNHANKEGRFKKKIPWDVCIVCNQKGCHSSVYRKTGDKLYKRFAHSCFAGNDQGDNEDDTSESEEEEFEEVAHESESYITFTGATAAMGLAPKQTRWIVDSALIETGSNVISLVGLPLLLAVQIANMRNCDPLFGKDPKKVGGVGSSVDTIGTSLFYFHSRGLEYSIELNIIPGTAPLIITHKDLDDMVLKYQNLIKPSIDPTMNSRRRWRCAIIYHS